jgi:hypothetical protein
MAIISKKSGLSFELAQTSDKRFRWIDNVLGKA